MPDFFMMIRTKVQAYNLPIPKHKAIVSSVLFVKCFIMLIFCVLVI